MAAFKASKLVCVAMSSMTATIWPISALRWPSACTCAALVRTASRTVAILAIVWATAALPSRTVVIACAAACRCVSAVVPTSVVGLVLRNAS